MLHGLPRPYSFVRSRQPIVSSTAAAGSLMSTLLAQVINPSFGKVSL
ncbi:hypothetical protein RLPCCGM1_p0006 [Rhizobium leguminosarum bv. phaseoli CCGM1]|nr:hypothetical protein RLPCCGM1_p0006 [Rhizobium leguminosarum bv. phaseoli CCGM1]